MAELRKYNQMVIYAELATLCDLTPTQMKRLIETGNLNCLQHGLARLVASSAKGDLDALEFLLNRLVGKVKDKMEVTGPKPVVIRRRNGDEVELSTKEEPTSER
jgi:hypothetical protein